MSFHLARRNRSTQRVLSRFVALAGIIALVHLGAAPSAAQSVSSEVLYERSGLQIDSVALMPVVASHDTRGLVTGLNLGASGRTGFRAVLDGLIEETLRTSSFYRHLPLLQGSDSTLADLKRTGLTDEYLRLVQQFDRLGVVDSSLAQTIGDRLDRRYLLVPIFSHASVIGEAQLTGVIWDSRARDVAWEGYGSASTLERGREVLTEGLMEAFLNSLPLPATEE